MYVIGRITLQRDDDGKGTDLSGKNAPRHIEMGMR